jgi:hypothetical protein
MNTTRTQRHGEHGSLGIRWYNLGSPVQRAATSAPTEVKALGVDPRDEVDMDTSQGAHIRQHPARDGDREPVLSVLEDDELHTLVGQKIAKKKVDFENGALLHPSCGRT